MKKGTTLVEVLVAFSIFCLSIVVVLSTYTIINKIKRNEVDYLFFETICQDIDKYYTKYESNWASMYYAGISETTIYYDAEFKITNDDKKKAYELTYSYVDSELIVSVKNIETGRFVIENLNYGGSRNV